MKVLITLLTTCLFSLNSFAIDATHGMVLFGKEKLYASHLPMFHAPHDKQVVFTFVVDQSIKDQIALSQDTEYLTFVPAPFDLNKFVAAPFDLVGDIYLGHFEKDGVLLLSGVTLKNPKIEFLKENLQLSKRQTVQSFKIFGTENDTYALYVNDGMGFDNLYKLTTIEASNFEYLASNYKLWDVSDKLSIGKTYSITTPPGKCPSRNCGNPGMTLAAFNVDSLYFSDSVMGGAMPQHLMPEVKFCRTRLCNP